MYFLKPKKGADPLTQIFNLPQKMSDPPPPNHVNWKYPSGITTFIEITMYMKMQCI